VTAVVWNEVASGNAPDAYDGFDKRIDGRIRVLLHLADAA
jgi:hypothetical protein